MPRSLCLEPVEEAQGELPGFVPPPRSHIGRGIDDVPLKVIVLGPVHDRYRVIRITMLKLRRIDDLTVRKQSVPIVAEQGQLPRLARVGMQNIESQEGTRPKTGSIGSPPIVLRTFIDNPGAAPIPPPGPGPPAA